MDAASSIRSVASSSAGALARDLPAFAAAPPIEAVVFGWGVSEDGQLGLDSREDVLAPKVVEALLGTRFRGREFGRAPLVAGSRGSLAIDADGRLLTWGWNARGTLGHGDCAPGPKPRRVAGALREGRIVQAALGGWHCLAVDEGGRAWAWGGNEYGQCGFPPAPRPAVPSSGAGAPGGRGGWAAAAAAPAAAADAPSQPTTPCAAGAEGRDVASPVPVVPDLEVVQVSAGGMQSAALTSAGDVWVWGEPWGDFSVVLSRAPRPIPLPAPVAKVACGAFHTLALAVDGRVFAWGANDFGQLGTGDTSPAVTPAPVAGLEGQPAADVAAGGWHSLALGPDGGVHVWGRGEYGRLGLGAAEGGASRLRATRLAALDGAGVVQASAGGTHTVALTADGAVFAWGRGSFGRLGTGDEADRHAPVRVRLPGGPGRWHAVCVSAGGRHTLALALPDNGNLEGGRWSGGGGGGGSSDDGGAARAPSPPPPPPPPQPRSTAPAASPAGTLARPPAPDAADDGAGGLLSADDDDDASQPGDAVAAPEGVDGASDAGGEAEAAAEAVALTPPPGPRGELGDGGGGGGPGGGGGGGGAGIESSAAPTPGAPASLNGDADEDDDPGGEPVLDPAHGLAAAMARAAMAQGQLRAAERAMHGGSGGGGGGGRQGGSGRPPRGETPPSRLGGGGGGGG